jgi:hypothetical protein
MVSLGCRAFTSLPDLRGKAIFLFGIMSGRDAPKASPTSHLLVTARAFEARCPRLLLRDELSRWAPDRKGIKSLA